MDNQNIELRKLEEYLAQLEAAKAQLVKERTQITKQDLKRQDVLGRNNIRDGKREKLERETSAYEERMDSIAEKLTDLERKIFLTKDVISKEKSFRRDRDEASQNLSEVQAKMKAFYDALAHFQEPAVQADPVERNNAKATLKEKYQELTGKSFTSVDDKALIAQARLAYSKAQHQLDAVYGNVDQDEYEADRGRLEKIEKRIEKIDEKPAHYATARTKIAALNGKPDLAKKIDAFDTAKKEYDAAKAKADKLQAEIDALETEIQRIQKRMEEIDARLEVLNEKIKNGKLSPEEQKEYDGLKKERAGLYDLLNSKIGEKETKEEMVKGLKLDDLKKAFEDAKLPELQDYIDLKDIMESKLGIKDYKFDADMSKAEALLKAAEAQDKKDRVELRREARDIVQKYGAKFPAKKGNFVEVLDGRIEDIRKNQNPYHIQDGWEIPGQEHEEEEIETPPAPEPEGPSGGPGGPGGGPGGPSGAPGSPSGGPAGNTPPAPSSPPDPNKLPVTGNPTKEAQRLGVIVEVFDGSIDMSSLRDTHTRITDKYVYRVAPTGEMVGDPPKEQYACVRDDMSWYFKGTKRKLKKEVNVMLDEIGDMTQEDRDALLAAPGEEGAQPADSSFTPNQRTHLRGIYAKGFGEAFTGVFTGKSKLSELPKAALASLTRRHHQNAFTRSVTQGRPDEIATRLIEMHSRRGDVSRQANACGKTCNAYTGRQDATIVLNGKTPTVIPKPKEVEGMFAGYKAQSRGETHETRRTHEPKRTKTKNQDRDTGER